MNKLVVTILAIAASVLSTVSLMPQVIRTWRTRSAADISAMWLIVALVSMLLWMSYGSLVEAQAIAVPPRESARIYDCPRCSPRCIHSPLIPFAMPR